jgi:hypothetical protein
MTRAKLLGFAHLTALLGGIAMAEPQAVPASGVTQTNAAQPDISGPRDPFWPVGWEPPKVGPTVDAAPTQAPKPPTQWDEARKLLQVTGLSRRVTDGRYFAIVKGIGVVEEGDSVSVIQSGQMYKWKIRSISSRGIVPERTGVYPIPEEEPARGATTRHEEDAKPSQ